jgi:hypothetical protein
MYVAPALFSVASAFLQQYLLVCAAFAVLSHAIMQVLPAVYLFVGRSLNATPVQLGTLTLCRAMVQVRQTSRVNQHIGGMHAHFSHAYHIRYRSICSIYRASEWSWRLTHEAGSSTFCWQTGTFHPDVTAAAAAAAAGHCRRLPLL